MVAARIAMPVLKEDGMYHERVKSGFSFLEESFPHHIKGLRNVGVDTYQSI